MIGHISLPERCANLCFGGRKRNRLFMAASQSLYSVYVNTQGVAGRLSWALIWRDWRFRPNLLHSTAGGTDETLFRWSALLLAIAACAQQPRRRPRQSPPLRPRRPLRRR